MARKEKTITKQQAVITIDKISYYLFKYKFYENHKKGKYEKDKRW